jgi:hypothetical protein
LEADIVTDQKTFKIEDNVPLPELPRKGRGRPFNVGAFERLAVGQSFLVDGSRYVLSKHKDLVRQKNHRMKGKARFHWDYETPLKAAIRVWRIE